MYICAYTYYIYIFVYYNLFAYICYVHLSIYTSNYIHINGYMYICIYICIYIYIYIYIHIYTKTSLYKVMNIAIKCTFQKLQCCRAQVLF